MCFDKFFYKIVQDTILVTRITNIMPRKQRTHQDQVKNEVESGEKRTKALEDQMGTDLGWTMGANG